MLPIAILCALIAAPLLLMLVLRSHGAIAFLSLCLGSVLGTYVASDVTDFLTQFAGASPLVTEQWVKLGLLVTPLLLALLFTRKTVSGSKQMVNFLPALATGILLALLVIPLLPSNIQTQITDQDVWHTLTNLRTAVILAGAFFSLLFVLITNRPSSEEKHKK